MVGYLICWFAAARPRKSVPVVRVVAILILIAKIAAFGGGQIEGFHLLRVACN